MSIEPPSIQIGELMQAIEDRLPFGRLLVAITLFVGLAAFIATSLTLVARFIDSASRAILRRPTQWPVITLGELLVIGVVVVGYVIASRSLTRIVRRLAQIQQGTVEILERSAEAVKRSTEAVEHAEREVAKLNAELNRDNN